MAPANERIARKGRVSKKRKLQILAMTSARVVNQAAVTALESAPDSAATPRPSANEPLDSAPRTSASKRKLGVVYDDVAVPYEESEKLPTTVVDLEAVAKPFAPLLCPKCKSPALKLTVDGRQRKCFVSHLQTTCTNCEEGYTSYTTTMDQSMEVNRKMVCAGLNVGAGYSNLMKFVEMIGMPGMTLKTHQYHVEKIFKSVLRVKSSILGDARARLWQHYEIEKHNPAAIGKGGILNVAVSFDGSWAKQGHTSKIGFASAVEVMTGLVVDFHIMSLFCQVSIIIIKP